MGQLYSSRNVLRRMIAQFDAEARKAIIASVSEETVFLRHQVERWNDAELRDFAKGALEENRRIAALMTP